MITKKTESPETGEIKDTRVNICRRHIFCFLLLTNLSNIARSTGITKSILPGRVPRYKKRGRQRKDMGRYHLGVDCPISTVTQRIAVEHGKMERSFEVVINGASTIPYNVTRLIMDRKDVLRNVAQH